MCLGVGYFPLLARRQGLALTDTHLEVLQIGPSRAHDMAHLHYPGVPELGLYHMERDCLRLADAVWRPYLEDTRPTEETTDTRRELVCLAVGDDPHGLEWLERVVQNLSAEATRALSGLTVLRLGCTPSDMQREAGLRLASRLGLGVMFSGIGKTSSPPVPLKPALAVLPTRGPDVRTLAQIAAAWGLPVIAGTSSWADGIAARQLPQSPAAAADVMARALIEPPPVADHQWRRTENTLAPVSLAPPPLITVCMVHHNRPETLHQAVASLEAQTYSRFEVVICDDGSTAPDAVAYLEQLEARLPTDRWRVIRQRNSYLGAARNTAVRHARGDFLLFMDDDNIARPNMVERFALVARQGNADVLTCFCDVFEQTDADERPVPLEQRLFLGNVPTLAPLFNVFGDANAMVRKSTFEACGGFTEDYGIGYEDWEFFLRAARSGARFAVVPESLFVYRMAAGSMIATTRAERNLFRAMRPFLEDDEGLGPFAVFAQTHIFKLGSGK